MKQPRVPEYREADGVQHYLKALTLFLKDFCMDTWTAAKGALPAGGTAKDSEKLGGEPASEYAKKSDIPEDTGVDFLSIYPVGSIYMSASSASPASLFGGTWEQLKDRFLLGAGDIYEIGSTGGEAAHELTNEEMPNHNHDGLYYYGDSMVTLNAGSNGHKLDSYGNSGSGWSELSTGYSGGGKSHNNMPPYLSVYMWKRVS